MIFLRTPFPDGVFFFTDALFPARADGSREKEKKTLHFSKKAAYFVKQEQYPIGNYLPVYREQVSLQNAVLAERGMLYPENSAAVQLLFKADFRNFWGDMPVVSLNFRQK